MGEIRLLVFVTIFVFDNDINFLRKFNLIIFLNFTGDLQSKV